MTAQHTPTPWIARRWSENAATTLGRVAADGSFEAIGDLAGHGRHSAHCEADAAFIVRACNAHDDLVAALRDMRARFNALRTAVHEAATQSSRENIQHRFNLHLDREGIDTDTQPALDAAGAALAKAGAA